MLGDPATASDADGGDFAVVEPESGEARQALPVEPQLRQNIDQHLFQLTHVPVQIRLMTTKIQHRIGHQLSGPVMRHFTPSVDAVQRSRGLRGVEMQVFRAGPPAEGVTGRMLQDPHRFGGRVVLQQALLPTSLIPPSLFKRHQRGRLKKNCAARVCQIAGRT